jgi:hypothetical protein
MTVGADVDGDDVGGDVDGDGDEMLAPPLYRFLVVVF